MAAPSSAGAFLGFLGCLGFGAASSASSAPPPCSRGGRSSPWSVARARFVPPPRCSPRCAGCCHDEDLPCCCLSRSLSATLRLRTPIRYAARLRMPPMCSAFASRRASSASGVGMVLRKSRTRSSTSACVTGTWPSPSSASSAAPQPLAPPVPLPPPCALAVAAAPALGGSTVLMRLLIVSFI